MRGERCYIVISLGNKLFLRPALELILEQISQGFEQCAIIIGDSTYHHTLRITQGLDVTTAQREAIKIGLEYEEEHRQLICEMLPNRHTLIRATVLETKLPDIAGYCEDLMNLCENDEAFRNSVGESTASYVKRRIATGSPLSGEEITKLSCRYLIEEMALFTAIVDSGWTVDVYPGRDLKTMKEIAVGLHPGVPEPLKRRRSFALRVSSA